jgi:hypothetical protein
LKQNYHFSETEESRSEQALTLVEV